MFFELHNEKIIAYKQLTDADLGRSKTSKQTHIGLFGDVFTYLPDSFEIEDSMLIYNNTVNFFPLSFDRIKNPDGSFRSPKIRKGAQKEIGTVTFIRNKAKEYADNINWYLFWFGLKSGQPVFFLFSENSDTYREIKSLGIKLENHIKNRITEQSPKFSALLKYLEQIVNEAGMQIVQDLEVIAQTSYVTPKNYRDYDMDKARKIFAEIGKQGEFLIECYFSKLKESGKIANYEWMNKKNESGLPYDFRFETKAGETVYLDVKTTNYKFSQKMIFSSQEIKFATTTDCKYYIYRVYTNENEEKCVKICTDAKDLFEQIYRKTADFEIALENIAKLETAKLAILPTQSKLHFGQQIILQA